MKGKKNFSIFGGHSREKFLILSVPLAVLSFFFCRQLQYMHHKKPFFLHCTWQWTRCESLSTPLKVIQLGSRATFKYQAYSATAQLTWQHKPAQLACQRSDKFLQVRAQSLHLTWQWAHCVHPIKSYPTQCQSRFQIPSSHCQSIACLVAQPARVCVACQRSGLLV